VIVLAGRVMAMLAGIAIVGLSFFGAVFVLFVATFSLERPRLDETFFVLTMASTDALIFAGGIALLSYASERRWPRWSSLRWLPILAAAGLAALMGATLLSPT